MAQQVKNPLQSRRHKRLMFYPAGWEDFLGRKNGKTTPAFSPEEFHGERSLVGSSPVQKVTESDTTE